MSVDVKRLAARPATIRGLERIRSEQATVGPCIGVASCSTIDRSVR